MSVLAPRTHAATLSNIKDTITTSRPSAASPLSADAASGVGQVSIFNNGSRFLASDSAKIIRNSGTFIDSAITVASQSAALTSVYFADTLGAAAQNGTDVLMVPVTAKHTITFNTVTTIPASGKIIVTFPGSANNTASPSATAFAFNNLVTGNVTVSGATCSGATLVVSSPTITCTVASLVAGGTAITVTVGSSTPALINPTKSAAAGTADTWTITVKTTDASDVDLDSASVKIGTVDSVQVQATVDPSLTVTIAGLTSGNNNNTVGGGTCGSESSVNVGVNATATFVNLGALGSGVLSRSAQSITVSTNAANGYAISATSSGRFINPESGFWITDANGGDGLTANDTPAPAVMTSGTPAYGISPCGSRVSTSAPNWGASGNTATFTGTPARFSNPWNSGTNSYYATLASYSSGAVASDVTVVRYGATISGTTPAGTYRNFFTYVVTPTF